MKKGKVARLVGFVGALGLSTALVTTAVQGTGAWFTDSTGSNFAVSSGSLSLLTSQPDEHALANRDTFTNLDFTKLMAGDTVPHTIDYKVNVSSGAADLWLVFQTAGATQVLPADPPPATTTKSGTGYQLFTGGGSGNDTGFGRYGYFSVQDSNWGMAFQSGNLKFPTAANDPATNECAMTNAATGNGGSPDVYDGVTNYGTSHDGGLTPKMCGVPAKIKLVGGLVNGGTGTVTISLGLNGPLTTWQNQPGPTVPFKLVAVQAGQTS